MSIVCKFVSYAASCSVNKSCLTLRPQGLLHARLPCLSLSQSWLKLMSIESVVPSNHLILCYPLLFLPSIFPSISIFSSESAVHIRWPKYWSTFSISPSNEYPGLVSFRIDWFDLAVQGPLKSLLLHHSWKASILWCSAFFTVHLISVLDYWRNHSFDYTDLCQQKAKLPFRPLKLVNKDSYTLSLMKQLIYMFTWFSSFPTFGKRISLATDKCANRKWAEEDSNFSYWRMQPNVIFYYWMLMSWMEITESERSRIWHKNINTHLRKHKMTICQLIVLHRLFMFGEGVSGYGRGSGNEFKKLIQPCKSTILQ